MISIVCLLLLLSVSGCKDRSSTVTPKKPAATGVSSGGAAGSSGSSAVTPAPSGQVTKIDFTITDAYFSPIYPAPNEETQLKFIVKNQGVEAASGFSYSIKIYKDGSLFKEEKFISDSALGAGNETKIIKMYTFIDKGTYYAEIYIDPDNAINELVETNNYMKSKTDIIVMDAIVNAPPAPDEPDTTD
ncbi:MAG: hypothetical protein NT001_01190 [Candidatus Woesearchaeota archaeon]|nr:hypothetical protein [Candidatus Woesearchaeota archaeon]